MVYAITYDLNNPGQKYPDLYKAIESLGITNHDLQNLWFVSTSKSADDISTTIKRIIDKNDRFFITLLHKGEIAGVLLSSTIDWLNTYLK